jgi:hypothetical protein
LIGGIIVGIGGTRLISGWLESSQLYIIGIPTNVSVGNPANFTFITFGNGESIGNANITLDGAAFTTGVTDMKGMVLLTVNATTNGSINVTAQKSGYRNATYSFVAIPGLVINANPTSITSNTPTYVTFSVSSVGKPVSGAYLNLTGANISLDGITNVNGEIVLQLNAPRTGSIMASAKKVDYSDGLTTISSTSQPTLSVSSSHSSVTINVPMYVTFTVTAGSSAVSDTLVSLTGTASGSGITNQEGKAIILVTPSGAGTITASANRTGFTGGSIAITSTGAQALSVASNPTSVTAGVPTYVTFTVTSGGSAVGESTVTLTGMASASGVTNPNGQVILYVNSTSSGAITATATKNGYSAGSVSVSAIGLQSLGVSASPANITNGVATYVTFTVTSGGSALSGATISVSGGGINTDGVTNSAGQATLLLNAGTAGTISVTARKAGYVDGLTTLAH